MNEPDLSNFIDAHKLDSNIYIMGVFYPGITIYNQQIRTLNLVYQLHKNSYIKDNKGSVVVIGGGISGVTAAMALSNLGYKTLLLEKKSILIPMQHGSTTRKVHPNLYDWPQTNSLKPYTELPFLNWSYADAGSVERIITNEFETEVVKNPKLSYELSVALPNGTEMIMQKDGFFCSKKITIHYCVNKIDKSTSCQAVFLATGFGLEQYVGRKEQTKSYWRNEDYGQLRLANQIDRFFISGVGDGGISDACRLKLTAFDPLEWANIFSKNPLLYDKLKTIRLDSNGVISLYDEFEQTYTEFKEYIDFHLDEAERKDITEVILNGKGKDIKGLISLSRMSFLNAWLLFLLDKKNLIKYVVGEFPNECGSYLFPKVDENTYRIIVRHGTDKHRSDLNKILDNLQNKIKDIKTAQANRPLNLLSIKPTWELQSWFPEQNQAIKKFKVEDKLIKNSSLFLNSVEAVIDQFINEQKIDNPDYRITLHRLVSYNDEYLFQQISPYHGKVNESEKTNEYAERAFPITEGVVGLAMRTNTAFSLFISDKTKASELFTFKKIFARELRPNTDHFLVIPILSPAESIAPLCFYLDSRNKEIAKNDSLKKSIYWLLRNFASYIGSINVNEAQVPNYSKSTPIDRMALELPELQKLNSEIECVLNEMLKFNTNYLVEIYDKPR